MTRAYARNTDPDTSMDAADSLSSEALSDLQKKVMDQLRANAFGLTVPEISEALNLSVVTVSPRIKPLVKRGLIENSGAKKIPRGHTRSCIIWRVRP